MANYTRNLSAKLRPMTTEEPSEYRGIIAGAIDN